jgi:hypothetical protein
MAGTEGRSATTLNFRGESGLSQEGEYSADHEPAHLRAEQALQKEMRR